MLAFTLLRLGIICTRAEWVCVSLEPRALVSVVNAVAF